MPKLIDAEQDCQLAKEFLEGHWPGETFAAWARWRAAQIKATFQLTALVEDLSNPSSSSTQSLLDRITLVAK